MLARQLNIAPASVDAMMLGEHGDTSFAALSIARAGGMALTRMAPEGADIDAASLTDAVRQAAYRIVQGKGYTSFGIATAIVRICEAIVRNEHVILPVSTVLTGQFGIGDLCLSLPCVLGAVGVHSAHVVGAALEGVKGEGR